MRSKFTVFAWLAAAAATRTLASGQCEPRWLPIDPSPKVAGVTCSALWDPDGPGPEESRVVLGGFFTSGLGVQANRIMTMDPATFRAWPLGNGSSTNISALVVTKSNALFACGTFSDALGVTSYGLWQRVGNAWKRQGDAIVGTVKCLAEDANGALIAGGTMSRIGSVPVGLLVRWDGSNWSDLGFGSSGSVNSICAEPDGSLLVAGTFSAAGGVPAANVARLSEAGWSSLGAGVGGIVNTVVRHTDGRVFVAGRFSTAGGVAARNIAVWNGTSWSGVGSGIQEDVLRLLELPDGRMMATGLFRVPSGTVSALIWNGIEWVPVGSVAVGQLATAVLMPNGSIILPGSVALARWDGQRIVALSRGPSFGTDVHTYGSCLARLSDGTVLLGGLFTSAGGNFVGHIARWDGVRWTGLGTGVSGVLFPPYPTEVVAIAARSPSDVYIAGNFTHAGETPANGIAHWNGHEWSPVGSGSTQSVAALAVLPDGTLAAGGSFTTIGGIAANRIAMWDGAAWKPLGVGFDGAVGDLVVLRDGTLVASGGFTRTGLEPVNGIAAWDGTKWIRLGQGVSSGGISAMTVAPNGDLLAGGTFLAAGNGPARRIARWDGLNWSKIGDGLGGSVSGSIVSGVAALPDGQIVVSGYLPFPNNQLGYTVFRWGGAAWAQMLVERSPDARTIAFHSDGGEVVIGGWYDEVFARFTDKPKPWIAYKPERATVRRGGALALSATPATGYSNVSFQWKRETTSGVFIDMINGVGGSGGVNGSGAGGTVSGASGSLASPTDGTAATLTVANATPADTGNYKVLFWNACGEAESVAVKVTVKGHAADINGDGLVDDDDFSLFAFQYDAMLCADPTMTDGCSADFNGDGQVDDADFNILAPAYNVMVF